MPAAGQPGAPRGCGRPPGGSGARLRSGGTGTCLPGTAAATFAARITRYLLGKKKEASMVTLTHIFFFSSICNLACCVCIRQEVDCLNSHLDPIVALLGRLLLLLLQGLRSLVLEGRRGLLEHRLVSGSLEQRRDETREVR